MKAKSEHQQLNDVTESQKQIMNDLFNILDDHHGIDFTLEEINDMILFWSSDTTVLTRMNLKQLVHKFIK